MIVAPRLRGICALRAHRHVAPCYAGGVASPPAGGSAKGPRPPASPPAPHSAPAARASSLGYFGRLRAPRPGPVNRLPGVVGEGLAPPASRRFAPAVVRRLAPALIHAFGGSGVGALAFAIHLAALPLFAAPPRPRAKPTPKPHLDFSGVWELDPKISVHVSYHIQSAVLSVKQKGNRIWISPVQAPGKARQTILSEEIVADGRAYEKALGSAGKGLVTADWAKDGKSLWIEVQAVPPEDPSAALQRSVWKLSEDRMVWVRESVSLSKVNASSTRLVFRKRKQASK